MSPAVPRPWGQYRLGGQHRASLPTAPLRSRLQRGREARSPRTPRGWGALPWGSRARPRVGSYALGMAGATRWRHRDARSAPAFIPLAIGTRGPPSAPSPRSPDTPRGTLEAGRGRTAAGARCPRGPPAPGRGSEGAVARGRDGGSGLSPPLPPRGDVGSTPSPSRHVQHRAQPPHPSRAPLARRVGTGTNPAPAGPWEMLAERGASSPMPRAQEGPEPGPGGRMAPGQASPGSFGV